MLHGWKYVKQLSAYRDHSLSRKRYRSLWRHLFQCEQCREELSQFDRLGNVLRSASAAAVPSDLPFRIQLRVSQERMRRQQPGFWRMLQLRWSHLAVPGVSGLVAAVTLFAFLIGGLRPAGTSRQDAPLVLQTPARLVDTGPAELTANPDNLLVRVLVDRQGQVADFDIVSGEYTAQDVRALRNRLLFTRFDPATVFGTPQYDTLLLSFHSVHVRG